MSLFADDWFVEFIVGKTYDPKYGSRRMEHAIEWFCLAPLAQFLAENPSVGGCALKVHLYGRDRPAVKRVRAAARSRA